MIQNASKQKIVNPIAAAVVEGIGLLEWNKSNIKVLSIGCTNKVFDKRFPYRRINGWLGYAPYLVDLFMGMQIASSISTAQTLIGKQNVFRVNDNADFSLDSVKQISRMKRLGVEKAKNEICKLKSEFFRETVYEPFVPYKSVNSILN